MLSEASCGFKYYPGNETEVCILFGRLMPYLGEELKKLGYECSEIYFDEFRGSFPDCTLIIDGKPLRVEFELYTSNFVEHGHPPDGCDLIVCWRQDRPLDKVKVLELYKVVERMPNIIKRHEHKRSPRIWGIQEFLRFVGEKLSSVEIEMVRRFFEELKENPNIEIYGGKGKLPIVTLHFRKQDFHSLWIEVTEKGIAAGIAYYNVNVKPPQPYLPEKKIQAIRNFLREPIKLWHYIKGKNTRELLYKLKKMAEIIETPVEKLNAHHFT